MLAKARRSNAAVRGKHRKTIVLGVGGALFLLLHVPISGAARAGLAMSRVYCANVFRLRKINSFL